MSLSKVTFVDSLLSSNCWANPSSGYASGRAAKKRVEECRRSVESMLGVKGGDGNIIFTSGGTEVGNDRILGLTGINDIMNPHHN